MRRHGAMRVARWVTARTTGAKVKQFHWEARLRTQNGPQESGLPGTGGRREGESQCGDRAGGH
eukprot:4304557-Pyramimonas_sp.AAC.1